MKHIFASAAILTFFISACKKDSFTTAQQVRSIEAVNQNASLNAAQPFKDHYDIDLSEGWLEFNSCTGELIDIVSGIWHVTLHTTTTADNRLIVKFHNNTSDYKLINLSTGVEYTGSYVSNDQLTINLADLNDQAPAEETITLSVLLTTPGGGNNSKLNATYHITINANGVVTAAWFDNWRIGCQ